MFPHADQVFGEDLYVLNNANNNNRLYNTTIESVLSHSYRESCEKCGLDRSYHLQANTSPRSFISPSSGFNPKEEFSSNQTAPIQEFMSDNAYMNTENYLLSTKFNQPIKTENTNLSYTATQDKNYSNLGQRFSFDPNYYDTNQIYQSPPPVDMNSYSRRNFIDLEGIKTTVSQPFGSPYSPMKQSFVVESTFANRESFGPQNDPHPLVPSHNLYSTGSQYSYPDERRTANFYEDHKINELVQPNNNYYYPKKYLQESSYFDQKAVEKYSSQYINELIRSSQRNHPSSSQRVFEENYHPTPMTYYRSSSIDSLERQYKTPDRTPLEAQNYSHDDFSIQKSTMRDGPNRHVSNVQMMTPMNKSPRKITIVYSPSPEQLRDLDNQLNQEIQYFQKTQRENLQSYNVLRSALDFIENSSKMPQSQMRVHDMMKIIDEDR